jgi:ABC-2 type transport system ATP-binding protein
MQQRLHLARVLLHDPELIFLDEPTVGIDPVGARELRSTIKQLKNQGKTILLTTHYMAEADELCDRIAIINQGQIIAMDSPASLKTKLTSDAFIELKTSSENLPTVKNVLAQLDPDSEITYNQRAFVWEVNIRTRQPGVVMELLAPLLSSNLIQTLGVRNQTMEDVYVSIIQNGAA